MNAIFMVTDRNYFKYLKASINSIKANWPNHPEIIVSYKTDEIEEDDFNFLRKNKVTIRIYKDYDFRLPLGPIGNDIIYQKFFLWNDDYFEKYDNILHLDSDTLVLQPLDNFINDNFNVVFNKEQVPHINVFGNMKNESILNILKRENFNYPEQEYSMVNAGIFNIPKKYRDKLYHEELLKMGSIFYDWIKYADQSIITLWCQSIGIKPLINYNYNFQSTLSSICEWEMNSIKVIHFSGIKPDDERYLNWNWLDKEFAIESQKLFYKYLEM